MVAKAVEGTVRGIPNKCTEPVLYGGSIIYSDTLIKLFLFQLAETLLKKETLNYDDVEKLIGPPPFGKKRLIDREEFEQSVNKEAGEEKSQQQQQQQS